MFGIELSVAKFAYDTHGYDEPVAKLTDPTKKQAVIATAKSLHDAKTQDNKDNVDKVSDFFQSYSASQGGGGGSGSNNGNGSSNTSSIGGKVKGWFSKSSGNSESKNNEDTDFKIMEEFDEKFLDIVSGIKRTKSDNTVQQCCKFVRLQV